MASILPSGVVTLLFTDIEGSTRLLRELGNGYGAALAEHRRVVRQACTGHGGVEVDTQGDAFFVAFAGATDAVVAASEAQRALSGGPIRVRMGLHTGEPRVTEEGYVGLDVHKSHARTIGWRARPARAAGTSGPPSAPAFVLRMRHRGRT